MNVESPVTGGNKNWLLNTLIGNTNTSKSISSRALGIIFRLHDSETLVATWYKAGNALALWNIWYKNNWHCIK